MYLDYWKLKEFPFENVPDPKFIFLADDYEEALIRLLYTILRKKGAALLTGEIGCGKTTLSRVLIEKLAQDRTDIGIITNPGLNPIEFLKEIAYQFGIPVAKETKVDILKSIHSRMLDNMKNNKKTILVVDEAQLVPKETCEEIRLLLNFQLNDRFLLTIILIGQPELRSNIKEMKQLVQRIAISYHLHPMTYESSNKYIAHRLKLAGAEQEIFTPEALGVIYEYSQGIPRKINNVCDMCLMVGVIANAKDIDAVIAGKVAKDIESEPAGPAPNA